VFLVMSGSIPGDLTTLSVVNERSEADTTGLSQRCSTHYSFESYALYTREGRWSWGWGRGSVVRHATPSSPQQEVNQC